jgi:hypothetical protein
MERSIRRQEKAEKNNIMTGLRIRVVFEQRFDLCRVSGFGGIMNPAAEGDTAPSQYEQY